jgi:protoporphyrinogen oxidase
MTVAVVGGGITGVSVAYRLAADGVPVILYERNARPGGLLDSFPIGHTWLEKYFHHIFLSDTAARRTIAELGLEKDLFWGVPSMGFFGAGRIHPFNGPLDLLRLSVLSLPDRLRLGAGFYRAGRAADGLGLDDRTAKAWVEGEWGGRIYERFWGPLLGAKFSAAWLWGRIHARAHSRARGRETLGYLRGGFVRLLDAMLERIVAGGGEVRLDRAVRRVERTRAGRWVVRTQGDADEFDAVVLAVPSPLAAALCPDLPPDERVAHERIEYVAVTCLAVLMDRPLSPVYWLNVGDRTIPFAGVIEHTNYLPSTDYDGMHVAYLFNYLPQGHPWLAEPKEALFAIYEHGLRRMFPGYRREHVRESRLFHDPFANVIYRAGYVATRPPHVSRLPGILFASTAHIFPEDRNQNSSIELAERVAALVER